MELFLLKIALPTLLIGGASLAARRWGAAVGGWLVGLPLTSGPVVLLLALVHGNAFAAHASNGILLGLVSGAVFSVVYALLARRAPWPLCWAGSWAAFVACTAVLDRFTVPLAASFVAAVAALAAALPLLPAVDHVGSQLRSPRWETPLRMLSAATIVVVLTAVAGTLGPRLSGLLTPFPVAATILTVFTHRLEGAPGAVRLLRGFMAGNFAFAAFFLIVATRLQPWGLAPTFAAAVGVACAVQLAALAIMHAKGAVSLGS